MTTNRHPPRRRPGIDRFIDYSPPSDHPERFNRERSNPVTVCVAAVCHGFGSLYIVGATDHKVTAGDVTFEPPTAKVWNLGMGVAALVAGDVAAQGEICAQVAFKAPGSVHEAIDAYCDALVRHNRAHAERKVLSPFGLTMESFLANQERMSESFIQSLQYKLSDVRANVETIICGIDRLGPHLYKIADDGCPHRYTSIGFAAIGDGGRHAESQFMFAKYTPTWTVQRALPLLYSAKKRAEVAPGVGEETDLFFIEALSNAQPLNDHLCTALKIAYEHVLEAQRDATAEADAGIAAFFDPKSREDAGESPTSTDSPRPPDPSGPSKPEDSA